ncbi:hypothetical protein MMC11_009159, partial [Xylographa trunciseda]|nr:hypothetical protein [Xylographa trunciseda]
MWGYEKMPLEKLFNLPGKRTENLAPESDLLPLLNDRRKRRLRHALKLMYRDEFTKDGSMPNKSIIKSTNGKMKYGWCGPIIAVAQGINRTSDPPYEDITLHDFRDIVDYFLTYDGTSRSVSRAIIVKKVQAIRINCPAHIAATGEPKFLVEEIDTSHPVFTMQPDFDSITWNIKLPLLLFPCPPNKKWFSEKATYCNFTAACVELSCSEDLESLKNWQVIGGDALVVRCDCKDLLLEHLEVLADFCETKIHRIMTDALDALPSTTYSHILKDVFADHATMEKFKIYWETYRRKKAISDERWRGLFSPYE